MSRLHVARVGTWLPGSTKEELGLGCEKRRHPRPHRTRGSLNSFGRYGSRFVGQITAPRADSVCTHVTDASTSLP